MTLTRLAGDACVAGLVSGAAYLIAHFRSRGWENRFQREMRAELSAAVRETEKIFAGRLDETARKLACAEIRVPHGVPAIRERIGRSDRARAIQLLRSGLAPATVAANLSLGAAEVRLIAAVSHALSADNLCLNPNPVREESRSL